MRKPAMETQHGGVHLQLQEETVQNAPRVLTVASKLILRPFVSYRETVGWNISVMVLREMLLRCDLRPPFAALSQKLAFYYYRQYSGGRRCKQQNKDLYLTQVKL